MIGVNSYIIITRPEIFVNRTVLFLHNNGITDSPWIAFVKNTLQDFGMSNFFVNQYVGTVQQFITRVKSRFSLYQFIKG